MTICKDIYIYLKVNSTRLTTNLKTIYRMLKKLALGILIAGVAPSALANLSEIDLGNELVISSPKSSCSQGFASFCGSQFNSTDFVSGTDSALSLRNIATSVLANSPFLTCDSKAYLESSASIYLSNYRQSQLEESQSNIFFGPGTKDSLLSLNTIAQPDCNFAWQQQLKQQLVTLELSKSASFTVRQDNPQERQVKQNFPTLSRSSLVVSFPLANSTFIPHQIKLANPAPETERIASPFGWRNRPYSNQRQFHQGIDYGAPYGSPVVSIGNGIVTRVVKGCADFGNLFCGGSAR